MEATARRERLRRVLNGNETVIPPAVFDAVSARIAELAGFEIALLSGSVSAASLQGVPDLILVTMTEVAQLAKRIVESGLKILQEIGYSMTLLASFPFRVAIQAMHDAVVYLKTHGEPGPYAEKACSPQTLKKIVRAEQYTDYRQRFMHKKEQ